MNLIIDVINHMNDCVLPPNHPYYTELSMLRGRLISFQYRDLRKCAFRFGELFQRQMSYFDSSFMQCIPHPNSGFRHVVADHWRFPWSYRRSSDAEYKIIEDKDYRLLVTPEEAWRRSEKVLVRANTFSSLTSVAYSNYGVLWPIEEDGTAVAGLASSQGVRPSMEDSMGFASFYFMTDEAQSVPVHLQWVMDGHCGPNCARLSSHWLKECFAQNLQLHGAYILDDLTICNAMIQTAVELDHMFAIGSEGYDGSGCTACWAVIINGKLYTANTGDSRAIVLKGDTVKALTCDQKPGDPSEEAHIMRRGGHIEVDEHGGKRVMGNLAMTRTFGDHGEAGVLSPRPEITIHVLEEREWLILACDGLWDVVSPLNVAEIIRDQDARNTATYLVQMALTQGTEDNVSVAVFDLDRLDERECCSLERDDGILTCPDGVGGLSVEKFVDAWEVLLRIINVLGVDRSEYDKCREKMQKECLELGREWWHFSIVSHDIRERYSQLYLRLLSQCKDRVLSEPYARQFIVSVNRDSWGIEKIQSGIIGNDAQEDFK